MTLKGLKDYIHKIYQLSIFENNGVEINLMNNEGKYSSQNDQDLHEILCIFMLNKNLKFTIFIKILSKLFNFWIFLKVCELYKLNDDPNSSIDIYFIFQCGYANTKEEKYKEVLHKLFDELKTHIMTTPLTYLMRLQKASIPISFSSQQLTHLKIK